MPRIVHVTPKYRRHKASGQAVVTIAGRDHYLGPWRSKASRVEYDRLIGEWLAAGRPPSHAELCQSDLTITELAAAYWRHAKVYYVKDGRPTGEQPGIKIALRYMREYYGHTFAVAFGPLALKAIQGKMIETGNSRRYINHLVDRIRRCFKWAVAQEIVPVVVYQALATVPGLRKGKTEAREPDPIGPVPEAVVEATLPFLPRSTADMVRLQRLTGCRPGEIVLLRPCDVDRTGTVWTYRPASHKTQHHGRDRIICIGPKAQVLLRPYLLRDADAFCFQTERANQNKTAGGRYTSRSYHQRVHSACDAADAKAHANNPEVPKDDRLVPRWAPNQLRHSAATEIRARYGLEAAATVLGHAKADVTQVYAERDQAKAAKIARAIG